MYVEQSKLVNRQTDKDYFLTQNNSKVGVCLCSSMASYTVYYRRYGSTAMLQLIKQTVSVLNIYIYIHFYLDHLVWLPENV